MKGWKNKEQNYKFSILPPMFGIEFGVSRRKTKVVPRVTVK